MNKLKNLAEFLYMRISILRDRIKLEIERFSKPKQRKQTILPSDGKRFQRNFFAHHGLLDFIFTRECGITFKSDVYQDKIQHFLLNEVPRR